MSFKERAQNVRKMLNEAMDEMEEVYDAQKVIYEMEYKIEPFFQSKKKKKKRMAEIEQKCRDAAEYHFQKKMIEWYKINKDDVI